MLTAYIEILHHAAKNLLTILIFQDPKDKMVVDFQNLSRNRDIAFVAVVFFHGHYYDSLKFKRKRKSHG